MMADHEIREAAESLLGSFSPTQGRSMSQSHSVNMIMEEVVAGHRHGGRMSSVRRFFCLLVTFDLLFTCLVWLICVMIRGNTLVQILDSEVVHYSIKVSLFDIVMAAACRFTALLLFYSLLHIDSWSVIAFTRTQLAPQIRGNTLVQILDSEVVHYSIKVSLFDIVMAAACRFTALLLFYSPPHIDSWSVIAFTRTQLAPQIRGNTLVQILDSEVVHYSIKVSLFDIVMAAACRFTALLLFYSPPHIDSWSVIAFTRTQLAPQIRGNTLVQILDSEVVHYSIKVSLFDIVMAAACRFTALLLFYSLLHNNSWSVIAFTRTQLAPQIRGNTLVQILDSEVVHYSIKVSLFDIVMAAACRFTALLLFYSLLHNNSWSVIAFTRTQLAPQIRGNTLVQILDSEVVHYSIKVSLFDIVMAAACRFTALLLFYSPLHINSWSVIAFTRTQLAPQIRGNTLVQILDSEVVHYSIKVSLFDIVMAAACRFTALLLFYSPLQINSWSVIAFTRTQLAPQIRGNTLVQILDSEVVHYSIKVSLFDIVMAAACRFTALLLFYSLLHINNWSVIALSTGCTCAFLVAKVFVYNWVDAKEPVYHVFLILTSFTLSWGEAWFLDFRVLPQELHAKQILSSLAAANATASERTPLVGARAAPHSAYGESTVNWFSPIDTPETSPRPRGRGEQVILTQDQIEEYKRLADASVRTGLRVLRLPGWRLEKRGARRGDVVESLSTKEYGKVFRFTGLVECPAKYIFEDLRDNLTKMPEWNPTILQTDLIKQLAPGVDLSYQVTAGGGNGLVTPRDFVTLRRVCALGAEGELLEGAREGEGEPHAYMSSGISVECPGYPPCAQYVRGNNKVGCWYLKPTVHKSSSGRLEEWCTFQWLFCCDLKGRMPQFLVDTAFATVMLDNVTHVRKHAAERLVNR